MSFEKPFNYVPNTGRWSLELHKAPKDVLAQCGIKISIDPGIPTGEAAPFFQTENLAGLVGSNIEIRCFDNLSGWTSAVVFDIPALIEALIKIMPEGKVFYENFVLAERDLVSINKNENEETKEENNV